MSYTAPPTFVADDVLAAADLNVLSDDIADLDNRVSGLVMSGCVVARNTNFSTSDATAVNLNFNVEVIDVGGWFAGTGTTAFTPTSEIPAGATTIGIFVTASVTFATNATGNRIARIKIAGSAVDGGGATFPGLPSDPTVVIIPGILVEVADGDQIQLEVEQTSGGALNVTSARFQFHRVGVIS